MPATDEAGRCEALGCQELSHATPRTAIGGQWCMKHYWAITLATITAVRTYQAGIAPKPAAFLDWYRATLPKYGFPVTRGDDLVFLRAHHDAYAHIRDNDALQQVLDLLAETVNYPAE